jgi:hypothetical protein
MWPPQQGGGEISGLARGAVGQREDELTAPPPKKNARAQGEQRRKERTETLTVCAFALLAPLRFLRVVGGCPLPTVMPEPDEPLLNGD